jgi:hypothetical protein
MWGGGSGNVPGKEDSQGNIITGVTSRRCHPGQAICNEFVNQSYDGEFTGRMDPNRPVYKPIFWDRVQDLDEETNTSDPIFSCQPPGLPRSGPPAKIVQTQNEVLLIYIHGGANAQSTDLRVVPIDGRKHDPIKSLDVLYYGHSVGRWDGDTLVIESVGFNDLTWLERGGYFHSDKMRIVERYRREGNVLHYNVTVEDPEVFLQPWVMNPEQLRLNTSPNAYIPESAPCKEYDFENIVTKIRH